MAPNKSSVKANGKDKKKASKLASIKQAIFGGGKKKKIEAKAKVKAKAPVKAAKSKPVEKPAPKAAAKGTAKGAALAASKGKGHKETKASEKPVAATKKSAAAVEVVAKSVPLTKVEKQLAAKAAKAAAAAARHAAELEAMCREVACEGLATSGGYCRLHYIKNWKKIKRKELILKEGKLNQYIEELVAKYPDKYIEAIRQDLVGDKDFAKVIHDLDLDESVDDFDAEGEAADNIIDSIKRDFDDEGEGGF